MINFTPTSLCPIVHGGTLPDIKPIIQGYIRNRGSPLCEDIDECAMGIHDCDQNQACRNIDGFYQCIANTNIPVRWKILSLIKKNNGFYKIISHTI